MAVLLKASRTFFQYTCSSGLFTLQHSIAHSWSPWWSQHVQHASMFLMKLDTAHLMQDARVSHVWLSFEPGTTVTVPKSATHCKPQSHQQMSESVMLMVLLYFTPGIFGSCTGDSRILLAVVSSHCWCSSSSSRYNCCFGSVHVVKMHAHSSLSADEITGTP